MFKLGQLFIGIRTRGHRFTFCQSEPYSGIRYELSGYCAASRGIVPLALFTPCDEPISFLRELC